MGVGLVILAGAIWAFAATRPPAPPEGVVSFDVPSHAVVDGAVAYEQTPPVGGDHAAKVENCGFYRNPIANENGVASMARGAVWITYKPDANPDDINSIRQLAVDQTYVLVSPASNLPSSIVASSWARQLQVDSSDDERLVQFIHSFRLSSLAPESGPCAGGIGVPE